MQKQYTAQQLSQYLRTDDDVTIFRQNYLNSIKKESILWLIINTLIIVTAFGTCLFVNTIKNITNIPVVIMIITVLLSYKIFQQLEINRKYMLNILEMTKPYYLSTDVDNHIQISEQSEELKKIKNKTLLKGRQLYHFDLYELTKDVRK